jgi:hypothetical protein
MCSLIFSDRELSVIIYSGLLLGSLFLYTLKNKDLRGSGLVLIKAFFQPKLFFLQILMLAYIIGQTYILYRIGYWHQGMLGSTLIWLIAPYTSFLKDGTEDLDNPTFMRQKLKGLVGYTAILEYIIGLQSFPFIAELIITPILMFVGFTYGFTKGKDEYKPLDKVTEFILGFYAIIACGYSSWVLISDWSFDFLWGFTLAITMSVLFTPFIFLLRLLVVYENVLIRMEFLQRDSNFPKWYALIKGVFSFGYNTINLQRWCDYLVRHRISSKKGIDASIKQIQKSIKREKNPVEVEIKDGWSPYKIKDCLAELGLPTKTYDLYFDGEWSAGSDYYKLEGGILPNIMTFNIGGTEKHATKLTLSFLANEPIKYSNQSPQFIETANQLFEAALGKQMPDTIKLAISNKTNCQIKINGKDVKIKYIDWPLSTGKGFEISLIIQNTDTINPE